MLIRPFKQELEIKKIFNVPFFSQLCFIKSL